MKQDNLEQALAEAVELHLHSTAYLMFHNDYEADNAYRYALQYFGENEVELQIKRTSDKKGYLYLVDKSNANTVRTPEIEIPDDSIINQFISNLQTNTYIDLFFLEILYSGNVTTGLPNRNRQLSQQHQMLNITSFNIL